VAIHKQLAQRQIKSGIPCSSPGSRNYNGLISLSSFPASQLMYEYGIRNTIDSESHTRTSIISSSGASYFQSPIPSKARFAYDKAHRVPCLVSQLRAASVPKPRVRLTSHTRAWAARLPRSGKQGDPRAVMAKRGGHLRPCSRQSGTGDRQQYGKINPATWDSAAGDTHTTSTAATITSHLYANRYSDQPRGDSARLQIPRLHSAFRGSWHTRARMGDSSVCSPPSFGPGHW
jgi:hypothetical protein